MFGMILLGIILVVIVVGIIKLFFRATFGFFKILGTILSLISIPSILLVLVLEGVGVNLTWPAIGLIVALGCMLKASKKN